MVIDLLIDKRTASRTIPITIFDHVYRNTQTNSSLRKLCVDWSVHGIQPRLWFEEDNTDCYPKHFLIDLVIAKYELKDAMGPGGMDFGSRRSDYYVRSPK